LSAQSSRAAYDRAHGHSHDHAHDHAHDGADPSPAHDGKPASAAWPAHVSSPLWWSAPQRLACASLLAVFLWLVIGWAVR
jgi:ABC-type Zn2+ transport system substrate-binding protein/surface adhesin